MTTKRFYVSYADAAFPRIAKASEGSDEDLLTFAAAKKKLLAHIRNHRDHWQEQLSRAWAMTVADVEVQP
jgi:hypothetical protein